MVKFAEEGKTQNPNQNQTRSKKGRARLHLSRAKKKVAQKKIRDKRGYFLGNRQIQIKIGYNPGEQRFTIESLSGNGKIDEKEQCSRISKLEDSFRLLIHKWRSGLQ